MRASDIKGIFLDNRADSTYVGGEGVLENRESFA